jgi:hypothetical protein
MTDPAHAISALKAFGKAMREYGEAHPITVRMWQNAINAQAAYRKASEND